MTIKEFLEKARENENKKLKFVELEVENFGEITFTRPKQSDILEYLSNVTKASDYNEETDAVRNVDMQKMNTAASKLVYSSCSLFQSKEIRDEYKELSPFDIPSHLFGYGETMRLAGEIVDAFDGKKVKEKVEADIKN